MRSLRAGIDFYVPQWANYRSINSEFLHVDGLYGLKKTVLDYLQMGSLTWEYGELTALELPCSLW